MSKTIKSVDHFGNSVETRVSSVNQEVILDIALSYDAGRYACTNIHFEQAREIAHAILEITGDALSPAKPLTFEDLEVGDKFLIGDDITRQKISENEYRALAWWSTQRYPKENLVNCTLERVQ